MLSGEYGNPMENLSCPINPPEHVQLPYEFVAGVRTVDHLKQLERASARQALGDACSICPCCDSIGVDDESIGRVACGACSECYGEFRWSLGSLLN